MKSTRPIHLGIFIKKAMKLGKLRANHNSNSLKNLCVSGLIAQGFQGKEGQLMPDMPDAFVNEISERYIELYETITGLSFERNDSKDLAARIFDNVSAYLSSVKD
jgi:hypothetical protein